MNGCSNNWGALKGAPLVLLMAVALGCPRETPKPDGAKGGNDGRRIAAIGNAGTNSAKIAAARRAGDSRKSKAPPKEKKQLSLSADLMQSLLESAAENGNTQAIFELADAYLKNPDPAARMEFVDALLGIEREGILPLTKFLSDPDKEVSARAASILETQLDLVEDNFLRTSLLGRVIMDVKGEDQLKALCAKLETLPANYAVRKIIDIVEHEKSNPAAAKIAKEEYETITGEKFRSAKDAHRWARMAER